MDKCVYLRGLMSSSGFEQVQAKIIQEDNREFRITLSPPQSASGRDIQCEFSNDQRMMPCMYSGR